MPKDEVWPIGYGWEITRQADNGAHDKCKDISRYDIIIGIYRMVGKVGAVVKFSNDAEAYRSESECTERTGGSALCCWCDNLARPPIEELMKGSLVRKVTMGGSKVTIGNIMGEGEALSDGYIR